ncbi:MAG: hypothetical protein ACRDDY_06005 [Clostridium sp.]|uniref:hypothetical protein n=1 Tax=Clostridium sp. TaxID=1506 RepID=UPI003EE6DD97
MIRIKIEKNRFDEPIFKISIQDEELLNNRILKRVLYESTPLKGLYNYKLPMRFFYPVVNNLNKETLYIDTRSNLKFLEFTDDFDEEFHYSICANAKYMKKWREFNCPNIFVIEINPIDKSISKRIAFKKIGMVI